MSATTQAAEGLMRRRWSVAELDAMVTAGTLAEDERFELIGGEIVPMSPKGSRHERGETGAGAFLVPRLPDEIGLILQTTFRLDKDTFVEPDFVFFRAADGLASLSPATALLAVEVADSSLDYDLKRKTQIYAVHGVREVWVIEAESLTTHVRRAPGLDGHRERLTVGPDVPLVLPFAPDIVVALRDLTLP